MASFCLHVPCTLRKFSISASSNGAALPSQNPGPVIVELPLTKIRRPLMRTRENDPQKVQDLMESIQEIGLQVPIRGSAATGAPNNSLQSEKGNEGNLEASPSLKYPWL